MNCSSYKYVNVHLHGIAYLFFTVRKSYPGLFSAAQTSKVSAIDINY